MQFENRTPDEHVNYSVEHPLKEFAWLVGGVIGGIIILTLLMGYFAGEIAARLPYHYEKSLTGQAATQLVSAQSDPATRAIEAELNRLAARLQVHMPLPEGMQITVHYQASPEVNAFATLGANIVIYQGLLARMPDENALAMVLAHEMAHAQLRHPARSLGRGVAIGIILSVVHIGTGQSAAGRTLGSGGELSLLKFSRDQERDADAAALAVVAAHYKHIGGALDVFRILAATTASKKAPRVTMLSTHPLSQERIDTITTLAQQHGWVTEGARTPLAAVLRLTSSK